MFGVPHDKWGETPVAAVILSEGAMATAEEAQATELGIGAVPTFVIERRWAIPGAQDVDTFLRVLGTAAERLAPLPKTD